MTKVKAAAIISLLVTILAPASYAEGSKCHNKETFTIGAEGGEFTYKYISVRAKKGELTKDTEFAISQCPDAGKHLEREISFVPEDSSDGKKVTEKIGPDETFQSIELVAPNGLHLADGAWLNYCLIGDNKNPLEEGMAVFHEDKAGPLAFDHIPSKKRKLHTLQPPQ